MSRVFLLWLALACCWSLPALGAAQAPGNSGSSQNPAAPNAGAQKPKSTPDANPFPEDTNSVPVMPSANSPGTPSAPPPDAVDYGNVTLPNGENDPVRSPDDPDSASGSSESSSSSSSGVDELLKPPPDTAKSGKHGKDDDEEAAHHEGPKEDESVGSYYLDQKNWKAALSRFESALVLDPENPEVYWGLGEAERHLGDFSNAKAHYMKLVEYDPDSRHGKEAKKILKQPELANAPTVSSNAPVTRPQQ